MSNTWIKYAVVEWRPRLSRREPRQIKRIISRHKGVYAARESLMRQGPGPFTVERWT